MLITLYILVCYLKIFKSTECPKYVLTEEYDGLEELKQACDALNGKIASEDLKDRLLKFNKNINIKKNDITNIMA